jgi:hypothetical protein
VPEQAQKPNKPSKVAAKQGSVLTDAVDFKDF